MNKIRQLIEDISWCPYWFKNEILCNDDKVVNVKDKSLFSKIRFQMEIIEDEDFRSLSRNIQAYKFREPRYSTEYYDFVDDTDIVLDVGANIGYFTMLSSEAERIIAIEPVERCIPILKRNIELNDIKNVEILNVALGDGTPLYIKEDEAVNLSKIVDAPGENISEIQSFNLKHFSEKYNINFIKMDAEGYEYQIFGKGNVPKSINKIAIEFHTGLMGRKKSTEIINNLYRQGFYVEKLIEDLPLRLYPFMRILTPLLAWSKNGLSKTMVINKMMKGRGLKYMLIRRGNQNG